MNVRVLILKLRECVKASGAYDQETMRSFAELYREKSRAVQQRLSDAAMFKSYGFVSEAIRLCEQEPDCFKELETLDFRGRDEWLEIAEKLGVRTPDLPFALAQEIMDLYDTRELYADKAAAYRLMNALKSPKQQRERVLVALKRSDPQNPLWRENLELLQNAD